MDDLLLECANLSVTLAIFLGFVWYGKKIRAEHHAGWRFIVAGFFLLILGHLLGVLDQLPLLEGKELLSKIGGPLPGYLLLAVGFHRWFPFIVTLDKTEKRLRRTNQSLEQRMNERKQAMRELARARDQAEETNHAKDAFLATISHEVRTPINIVLGMQELLQDAKLTPKFREYLHLSTTAGKRLLFLVNDLLDFAQIDQGKFSLDYRMFDLRELMDEVSMILAPLASAKGVELTAHISSQIPTTYRGDPNRLGQIFTNLVTNAIKFTPAAGSVELHGGPISHRDGKTKFLFEVRDTGIGIPPEKRDAVFNRFTQIDSSTSRIHEGTGLGLAICKHLALLMGGEIGIDQNIHAKTGSTFFFTVSLETPTVQPAPPVPPPLAGYDILLVDCQGLLLTLLTDHLEQWGATVSTNSTSQVDDFHVVIVDHKLGNTKEFLPLEYLTGKSQLLILTDLLDQAWDRAASYMGSITCLQKPVSAKRLLKAILNPHIEDHVVNSSHNQGHISSKESILIVDDQTTNLLLTKALLEKIGFTEDNVDMADSGPKAIELARKKRYQLILLDLRMPGMDGFETSREIRIDEEKNGMKPVPVVAFTGDVTKKSRRRCAKAQMAGLLAKPASLADLKAIVQTHFSYISSEEEKNLEQEEATPTLLISALETMGLPVENYREVAEVLAEQLPSLLNGLDSAITAQEEEKARSTAHVLKGSMVNVLFPTLKEPASNVHQHIRAQEWVQAKEKLGLYRVALRPIIRSIQAYLDIPAAS